MRCRMKSIYVIVNRICFEMIHHFISKKHKKDFLIRLKCMLVQIAFSMLNDQLSWFVWD